MSTRPRMRTLKYAIHDLFNNAMFAERDHDGRFIRIEETSFALER